MDGHPGLRVQPVVEGERQVDTPQMAQAVLLQGLEDDPARDPVRDTGLDHHFGPGVLGHAPHRLAQQAFRVAVVGVGVTARSKPASRQPGLDIRHYLVEPLTLSARPRGAEQLVQVLIPGLVRLEFRMFLTLVPPAVPLPEFAR